MTSLIDVCLTDNRPQLTPDDKNALEAVWQFEMAMKLQDRRAKLLRGRLSRINHQLSLFKGFKLYGIK